MLFENNCYISVRSSPLISWSFLVRSLARNFSRSIKCTSQIWKCAVIGLHFFRSFQEMFVREDCVTSQKNVCSGGYKACRHMITFFWSFFFIRNIKGFRAAKWAVAFEIFLPLHRLHFFFWLERKKIPGKTNRKTLRWLKRTMRFLIEEREEHLCILGFVLWPPWKTIIKGCSFSIFSDVTLRGQWPAMGQERCTEKTKFAIKSSFRSFYLYFQVKGVCFFLAKDQWNVI